MILADTGAIYALADRRDAWHERMRRFWDAELEPWLVPASVVTEAAFLFGRRLGPDAEADFVGSLAAGVFAVETLETADYERSADLIRALAARLEASASRSWDVTCTTTATTTLCADAALPTAASTTATRDDASVHKLD